MERKLYEASLSGNVQTLNTLIQEDRLILDRVTVASFNENPLHIAALRGHLDFTRTLMSLNPNLASELDSCGRSPLHLASDKGHVDIVRELLRARSTDVCLRRDKDGMIPLHLAVMKGRVGVIQELIQAEPDSIMVRLDRGETVLHLCVRYNGLEALKLLAESVHSDELVNSKDDDGNTIFHVAAAFKQIEIVKYLLSRTDVTENANALNGNGFTALDVLEHCPRDLKGMEIRDFLLEAGVKRACKNLKPLPPPTPPPPQTETKFGQFLSKVRNFIENEGNWLEEARGNLIMAATVTATIAFQAGINPPGGFWQDAKDAGINPPASPPQDDDHQRPGYSILASERPSFHSLFLACNTMSLVASLSIILLMISGFSLKNKFSMWLIMVAMSITVSSILSTYLISLSMTVPDSEWITGVGLCTLVFVGMFCIVMLLQTIRLLAWLVIKLQFVLWLVKKLGKFVLWLVKKLGKFVPKRCQATRAKKSPESV